MYFYGKVGGLLCAVAQAHGCYHVALGRDAHARAAPESALVFDLFPQVVFGAFYLVALWVVLDFLHYEVDFLELHVHDVVHDALRNANVLAEQLVVEVCLVGERVYYVRVKVD